MGRNKTNYRTEMKPLTMILISGILLEFSTAPVLAEMSSIFDRDSYEHRIYAIEATMTDNSVRECHAFVIGPYLEGTLLLIPNSVVRTEDPDLHLKKVFVKLKDLWSKETKHVVLRLMEVNDPHRNLAILYADGRWEPDSAFMGSSSRVAPEKAADVIVRNSNGELQFVRTIFTTSFQKGRASIRFNTEKRIPNNFLGAVVIVDEGYAVGLVQSREVEESNKVVILSLEEVILFCAENGLPFNILPDISNLLPK
ncbi:MAG: hypothetical protein PVF56_20995 [Desulfobacterales bacterium]